MSHTTRAMLSATLLWSLAMGGLYAAGTELPGGAVVNAVLAAPTNLTATPGGNQVALSWASSVGATSYNLYRGLSAGAEALTPVQTGIAANSYTNTGLLNGTKYYFKVAAVTGATVSAKSNEVSATPVAPPPPTNLSATAGNKQVALAWTAAPGAVSYNVYIGTATNLESSTPIATGIATTSYLNTGLTNGTQYYYKVAAVSAGTSGASNEASATPTGPGLTLTPAQKDAFHFLRQSTWGPTLPWVGHVAQVGKSAFIDEQFTAPPSQYPNMTSDVTTIDVLSRQFFVNGMQGPDQLRQRVAWAISQFLVVSAVKVYDPRGMVSYIRLLEARAFDNWKDIMHDVALNPAMGLYLDEANNKKAASGILPNENFAREWVQLFSIGLQPLNLDGSPAPGGPTYTQTDVMEMARVLTGWTYGDTNSTNPTSPNPMYFDGPLKPMDPYHDTGQKIVMGTVFPAGQTAQQDFDQALNMIFNHPNVGPFLSRQLIQRLVTSNPSPTYIRDVATVFNNNGQGVRGDMKAVIKAILLHPEAANGTPTAGKFSEPALFLLTFLRGMNATVTYPKIVADYSQLMQQRAWFAPSVFNYYLPGYQVGTLYAPELQIWNAATALARMNFVAGLLSGGYNASITADYSRFTPVAPDPNALLDTVDSILMGGTMSAQMRQSIITAVNTTPSADERMKIAIYLAATSMQYQVEH